MIFGSRKRDRAAGADGAQLFEQIGTLSEAIRDRRDPEAERKILKLRHAAGALLTGPSNGSARPPEPDFAALPEGNPLPEVAPADLTPGLLRAGILRDGCLLVRGLLGTEEALRLRREIDLAFEARAGGNGGGDGYFEEFVADPPFDLAPERGWVSDSGGIWAADSPRVMFEVLDSFERAGLRTLITDYLGERPAISVNKCTLRKVSPDAGSAWHQDGAFLGDVRALNVWLALSRCGDEAPGLDIVPRRLDHIVPTGTEGAIFDWSVSPANAEEAAGDRPILRPIFEPGDVLLFDDLFLHATAAEKEMPNARYAVESWFFGPSGFPPEYVPLAF